MIVTGTGTDSKDVVVYKNLFDKDAVDTIVNFDATKDMVSFLGYGLKAWSVDNTGGADVQSGTYAGLVAGDKYVLLTESTTSRLIEQVKNAVVTLIHHHEDAPKMNFSDFIAEKVNYDYNYLSNLFSEVEGITIEKYLIAQRIERFAGIVGADRVVASVFVAQKRQAPETSPAPTYQVKTTLDKCVQSQTTHTSISGHANPRFHVIPEHYNTNQ